MAMAVLGVIGFSMLLGSGNPHIQYGGTFLGALGIYPCIANTITWTANNVEGVYKRGIVLGFVIGWGNLNGYALMFTTQLTQMLIPVESSPRIFTAQKTSHATSLAMAQYWGIWQRSYWEGASCNTCC